jgi:DNA-binding transcriptional LysR family regulator
MFAFRLCSATGVAGRIGATCSMLRCGNDSRFAASLTDRTSQGAMISRRHKYFLAVAQHMGFRRAANALHVSQPALSQQIHLLEEELGVALFDRKSGCIQLTAAGEEYYKGVLAMNVAVQYWANRARDADSGQLGTLTVAAGSSTIANILPPVLLEFRKQWPDVRVRVIPISAAESWQAVLDRRVDIALTANVRADEDLESEALFAFARRIALPETAPQAQHEEVHLQELSGQTLLVPASWETLIGYHDVLEICRAHHFKPGVIEEVAGHVPSLTMVGLIACGLGIAIMSTASEHLRVPSVVFKPIAGHDHLLYLYACWRRDAQSILIEGFTNICRAMVQSRPRSDERDDVCRNNESLSL